MDKNISPSLHSLPILHSWAVLLADWSRSAWWEPIAAAGSGQPMGSAERAWRGGAYRAPWPMRRRYQPHPFRGLGRTTGRLWRTNQVFIKKNNNTIKIKIQVFHLQKIKFFIKTHLLSITNMQTPFPPPSLSPFLCTEKLFISQNN